MAVTWRRPRIRWVVVPVCLLLIAAVIGGLPIYVRPQVDPLRHADAILVLGGDGFSRYPFGVDLGMQGWAPKVVLSNPGTDNEWLTKACNTPHPGIELDLFRTRSTNNSGRRAGTAPASRAIPLAECDCRHVHAAHFPGPVHPAALLRRRTHHGSEPDPFIVTGLAGLNTFTRPRVTCGRLCNRVVEGRTMHDNRILSGRWPATGGWLG